MAVSLSEIIRILSLKEVLLHKNYDPLEIDSETASSDYYWRRIARYYSSNFHTSLHIVETLPKNFVFQHVFESQFELLSEDDSQEGENKWNDIIERLADTEEESIARNTKERENKQKGDEFAKMVQEEEKAKDLKIKLSKKKDSNPEGNDFVPFNLRRQIEKAAADVDRVLNNKDDEISINFNMPIPKDD